MSAAVAKACYYGKHYITWHHQVADCHTHATMKSTIIRKCTADVTTIAGSASVLLLLVLQPLVPKS
jgi:hypothetical protein